MRQTCHEAAADRIGNVGEHNRDGTRLPLQWCQGEGAAGENHIRPRSNKLDCGVSYPVAIRADPAIFNADVSPVRPAELLKAALKCVPPPFSFLISFLKRHQYADERHFSPLLACNTDGHTGAAPQRSAMNSRRLIRSPRLRRSEVHEAQ